MKKLILHIGFHKTGTTSIQRFLAENSDKLKTAGWELFDRQPDGSRSSAGHANAWVETCGKGAAFRATVNEELFKEVRSTRANLILSMEELAWINSRSEINNIYNNFSSVFQSISIVCYLRRQDLQLRSHALQRFKNPTSNSRRFYILSPLEKVSHLDHYASYLDYSSKLGIWSEVFGERNIVAREYERKKLLHEDIVADFLDAAKIPLVAPTGPAPIRENTSLNRTQIAINEAIFSVRPNLWHELGGSKFTASRQFSKHLAEREGLSEVSTTEILSNYAISNKELLKYIPKLSDEWTRLDSSHNGTTRPVLTASDTMEALEALVRYFDEASLSGLLKVKIRKLKGKIKKFINTSLMPK